MSRYCVGGLMINCSPMPASDFEFRNRFLLVSAVFCLGFAAYRIDHVNVVERVLMWLSVPAARPWAYESIGPCLVHLDYTRKPIKSERVADLESAGALHK